MGELWCFTNLEQVESSETFSNKETHDLFQGRFTTTAHGDIIHSAKTGHKLSMKWWFVDGRNGNHHKFNHFLKCFVCTEHSPKTKMTMEKQPFQVACPMKDGDFPLTKSPMFLLPWWQKILGKKQTSSQRQQARNPSCQQVSNEKYGILVLLGIPLFFF